MLQKAFFLGCFSYSSDVLVQKLFVNLLDVPHQRVRWPEVFVFDWICFSALIFDSWVVEYYHVCGIIVFSAATFIFQIDQKFVLIVVLMVLGEKVFSVARKFRRIS